MTKKLIMFDIDGTLLDYDKKLPASAKEAVKALKKVGHEIAIATGRAPYSFQELREELEIDSFICFNGQYVEIENEVIYKNSIDRALLMDLLEASTAHKHPLVFMGAESLKGNIDYHLGIEKALAMLKAGADHPEVNADYIQETEIFQTTIFCEAFEEATYRTNMRNLNFIRWHKYALDVLPLGGSKALGIEKFIEKKGFTQDQVYAFGDNLNDIEMLQYVGHGVAMGNSPEEVKKIAKYVTKDVNDGGIVHGLKMVGLL